MENKNLVTNVFTKDLKIKSTTPVTIKFSFFFNIRWKTVRTNAVYCIRIRRCGTYFILVFHAAVSFISGLSQGEMCVWPTWVSRVQPWQTWGRPCCYDYSSPPLPLLLLLHSHRQSGPFFLPPPPFGNNNSTQVRTQETSRARYQQIPSWLTTRSYLNECRHGTDPLHDPTSTDLIRVCACVCVHLHVRVSVCLYGRARAPDKAEQLTYAAGSTAICGKHFHRSLLLLILISVVLL